MTAVAAEPADGNDRQRGSGTVLGAGLAMVMILLLAGLLLVAQVAVAASRAAGAADLAALAAADAARGLTSGNPCEVAEAVSRQNGASLSSCSITGEEIADIVTSVALPPPWGKATGRSRAGPPP